mmetsp:Transcript_19744/g.17929  ORF Transcript_19744/g.17929 Transcript_19744/m.17929 type:complete len:351 (-) Transcript_19744:128-1180(-)
MGKASNILSTLGVILVAIIAYFFHIFTRMNWFILDKLKVDDFQNATSYTIREIPTTYYKKGKLGEVLPKWHTEGLNTYIHLYRLEPGETFDFDLKSMNASSMGKKKLQECRWDESALCAPCFDTTHVPVRIEEMLLSENGSDFYIGFGKINEFEVIKRLWDDLNVPIDIEKLIIEQGFISNFNEDVLTAPLHGNGVTSSMAVQYVGKKTWVFVPPKHFQKDGAPSSVAVYLTKAPQEPYELFPYTSQPGDVLFFAEGWGHAVHTHAGPNVLINYRLLEAGNIFRQPQLFFPSLFYALYYRPNARSRDPYGMKVTKEAFSKINPLCDGKTENSPWDQTLMEIARKHAAANK